MPRPKAVKHADGSVTGAKVFLNVALCRGDLVKGKLLTYDHGGEIDCLRAITEEWEANGRVPWTLRHYFYVLVNRGLLKPVKGADPPYNNSEVNAYAWVSGLMTSAREAEYWGRDSWRLQNDPGTRRGRYYYDDNLREHVRSLARKTYPYDVNLWAGQKRRVVIVTEKDGLYSALESYGYPYGVVVIAAIGGFGSTTTKHEVAQELMDIAAEGQEIRMLYIGDHDASGLTIEADFGRTLERYGYHGDPLERIAVTREQAMDPAYIESRQPIEGKNANNARYLRETGLDYGVQVEAIPGVDLRRMVVDAIESHMDLEALEDAKAVNSAVEEWLGDHFGAIIADYEEQHERLDVTIRSEGELIDARTGEALSDDLIACYLPDDSEDEKEE
jgi:hypothetical protein